MVVLGLGDSLPVPKNIGDWMALLSGIIWAFGATGMKRTGSGAIPGKILAFLAGGALVSALTVLSGFDWAGAVPQWSQIESARWWILGTSLVGIPAVYLTIWPTTVLSPGRIGILLLSEILVATVTAALFSGEPFGAREAIGTGLIVLASVVELRT